MCHHFVSGWDLASDQRWPLSFILYVIRSTGIVAVCVKYFSLPTFAVLPVTPYLYAVRSFVALYAREDADRLWALSSLHFIKIQNKCQFLTIKMNVLMYGVAIQSDHKSRRRGRGCEKSPCCCLHDTGHDTLPWHCLDSSWLVCAGQC